MAMETGHRESTCTWEHDWGDRRGSQQPITKYCKGNKRNIILKELDIKLEHTLHLEIQRSKSRTYRKLKTSKKLTTPAQQPMGHDKR